MSRYNFFSDKKIAFMSESLGVYSLERNAFQVGIKHFSDWNYVFYGPESGEDESKPGECSPQSGGV